MPQSISPTADVLIIGSGVVGLAVGFRAARRGLRVCVLERDHAGAGTTRLAAGMLAPVAEADPAETRVLELGIRSAALYPGWIEELRELSGGDPGYLRCGTLLIARDGDEAQALARAAALREELGLSVRRLRPSQARELEPSLSPGLRGALELPDDHAVDPRALVSALREAFLAAGGELREGAEVAEVENDGDRVRGVVLAGSGERVAAGAVVIAAGVWSAALRGLPMRAPVRPVKGQILRLRDPAGPGLLGRVLRLEEAYIVPRGDGRYVLGATLEERGFDTTVTAGAVRELLQEASEALPGFDELVVEEAAAGLRPGTPDNLPLIGPAPVAGLHWATGHYRHGVLLAPVTAELVVEGLCGAAGAPAALGAEALAR